jgi:outer membrane immunogenic protein
MRRFLLAAIIFGGASGAHAADLPDFPALRGTYTDGPSSTIVNWQGVYIGGQAAYGSTNSKPTPSNSDLQSTFVPPSGLSYNWASLGPARGLNTGYGGFVGYNSQWDDVIIGIEGNYLHAGMRAVTSGTGNTYFSDLSLATTTNSSVSINVTDFGSARVRAGYVIGCFLPYLYAGVGVGSQTVERNVSASPPPIVVPWSSDAKSKLVYGYSLGAGFDVMLIAGLFLRAEYEYLRVTSTIESNINSARFGIGYKF